MNATLPPSRALGLTIASWISLGVVVFGVGSGCSSHTLTGGMGGNGGGQGVVVDGGGGRGGADAGGGACWTCARLAVCPPTGRACFQAGSTCCADGMEYVCVCPSGGHDCALSTPTCPALDAGSP